jgi:hypothetical protein
MAEKKQVIYSRVAHEQILAIMLFIADLAVIHSSRII